MKKGNGQICNWQKTKCVLDRRIVVQPVRLSCVRAEDVSSAVLLSDAVLCCVVFGGGNESRSQKELIWLSSISGASIVFCLTVITIDSHYNAATSKCFTLISDCSFLLASLCSRRELQASLLQGSAAPVPSVFLQFPLCFLFPCPSLNAPCPITLSLTSACPPSPFAPSAFHCRTLLKDRTRPIRTPCRTPAARNQFTCYTVLCCKDITQR